MEGGIEADMYNHKFNARVEKPKIENNVIGQEIIYSAGSRIRDVETGPDGYIYIALEDPGRIIRFISE